jgi:hypothetical protein
MEKDNYWVDASQMSTDGENIYSNSTIGSHRNVNLSYDNGNTNSLSKSMLADSVKTNIKTATNKIVQLERYIVLATWFLMVFSIITTFYAVLLIKWYFMPNLYFWDATFYIAPYNMLLMGVYTFLVAMFGLIMKGYEKRRWFVIYAVLLSIAFVGQLTSLYFMWQITTIVSLGSVGGSHVVDSLSMYQIDSKITNSWDDMQTRLMCCGGNNWHTGYTDYRGTPIGQSSDSVPDSCCISPNEGCGRGVLKESPIVVRDKIFVHGCVQVLTRWLENEVVTIIPIYAGVSLFVALVEIVTVAITCAYVSQITRRRHGNELL